MATTPPNLDQIDDDAQIEAELQRLKSEQQEPPKVPDEADTGIPPAEPEPPPKVIVEPEGAKPAEPTPAKPAEKPKEPTPAEQQAWGTLKRQLREKDRELAELRRQMQQPPPAEPKPPEKPREPTYEDDPAEYLKRRIEAQEAEIRGLRIQREQNDAINAVRQAEVEFERTHGDYREALKHLEETEVNEWEKSGAAQFQVGQLKQAVEAGRGGNRQLKPYADQVDAISRRDDVQTMAEQQNREPEDVAMWLIARDTYMSGRRQQVWQGAQALGRNPAEIAYELAQGRGYQPKTAQATQKDTASAARQRVLQAKEISAATRSLSDSSTADGGSPGPKVIRNRNDVLNLDDDALDALIESGRFREL
jgi:hypothetical protein